ncbi:MAG TPA: primosomal protein N' [Gammaproteobacteria bacterium]|nr:primosomal protein N' [Gammaproteobacteria bacterium]
MDKLNPPDETVLQVVVPRPLPAPLDYLPPADGLQPPAPGQRIRVPLGRSRCLGLIVGTRTRSAHPQPLKRALALIDPEPVLDARQLELGRWLTRYYHHAPGEAYLALLPPTLRHDREATGTAPAPYWRATATGRALAEQPDALPRAPRQRELLHQLAASPPGVAGPMLRARHGGGYLAVLRRLVAAELAEPCAPPTVHTPEMSRETPAPTLTDEQTAAVEALQATLGRFQPTLLEGVTGSGKTEVYLQLARRVLAAGGQVLILVPEIALTPQLLERFRQRLGVAVAALHSGTPAGERQRWWQAAAAGRVAVIVGTRSAVLTPLARPGLIIVDEEHDGAYKQQDGLRYHARDVAVWRARQLGVPVVLGSATPSLESLHNATRGRYAHLHLTARPTPHPPPALRLVDVRALPLTDGLSPPLLQAIDRHLAAAGQILLFQNRRGYAPILRCHACGWTAGCEHRDARLTLHRGTSERLICHHCTRRYAPPTACPACAATPLDMIGFGTARLEETLADCFPQARIARLDRDSTRRAGTLAQLLTAARQGEIDILIGTQMLAKGHDFPRVTLAGVIDADHGLFGADFRAGERMGQLIVQVAGRAGRAASAGEVLIQTHHPTHPLLQTLLAGGYPGFAAALLAEREAACWPPFSHLALLRAEASRPAQALAFLTAAAEVLPSAPTAQLLGPVPAPMERRQGRYRAQLLVQSTRREVLQRLLHRWLPGVRALPTAGRVRWSVDVEPQDLL